jgi:hypothetical protein
MIGVTLLGTLLQKGPPASVWDDIEITAPFSLMEMGTVAVPMAGTGPMWRRWERL